MSRGERNERNGQFMENHTKWEIAVLVFVIMLTGIISQPRSFIVEVRADIPFQKEAVLISRDNPNLGYKIPYSQLFLTYQIVDRLKVKHAETIKKLIKCESYGENVSRPDSDGIISDGILQYHRSKETPNVAGSGTWAEFSRLSGIKGSPNNIIDAIKMTDWAIENGKIEHWSCYWILSRKGIL